MLEVIIYLAMEIIPAVIGIYWVTKRFKKSQLAIEDIIKQYNIIQHQAPIKISAPDDPRIDELIDIIRQMPTKVLESIQSSTNHQKGKLGELIGYLQLNSQYDRLLSIRDTVDFIGIRFPKQGDPGTVDFIDIKNGQSARLTKDQMALKKILDGKHISFKKVKVDTTNATSSGNDTET
jgi:predicted Holliday junction resolvase-like endonuclease